MRNKKLILLALSLMALPTMAYSECHDKAPSLTISGESTGVVYAFKGSQRGANGGRGNGQMIRVEDSRINFDVFGQTSSWGGLEYSFLIGLSGNPQNGKNPVQENRIKLKGSWGTFFIGTHRGVDHIMGVGAFSTAGATGGVLGGSYRDAISTTTGALPTIDMVGTVKDANRVTYVTPRVSGLQFGVSFAPLGHQQGEGPANSFQNPNTTNLPFGRNITSVGLNYKTNLNTDTKLQLSAVGVFSKVLPGAALGTDQTFVYSGKTFNFANIKRVASYSLGALLSYRNFDLGFEFMDSGKSAVFSDIPGATSGKTYSLGLGYRHDDDRFSIGCLYNDRKLGDFAGDGSNPKARSKLIGVTWDRTLAPGLNLFAEANYFDMTTDQNKYKDFINAAIAKDANTPVVGKQFIGNNHGQVLLGGVKVKF